jgi:hypothetical protein
MEFVPALVLAVLLKKVIDWLRVMLPDHIEERVLIPASWVVGIGMALLFSTSEALAGGIEIWSGQTLADADIALVIVYGWAVAALGGVIHDFVKPSTPPHDSEGVSYAEEKPLPPVG